MTQTVIPAVIIGAGPIGLYWAGLLAKQGVHVLVLDPRAGKYTRPGGVYTPGLHPFVEAFKSYPDISSLKEIERELYSQAQELPNISFVKKSFRQFNEMDEPRGIYVTNETGKKEFIACEYVFDCSGSHRIGVMALNQQVYPLPFTIKKIAQNVPVKKHFQAYVHMSRENFNKIFAQIAETTEFLPNKRSPAEYILGIEMLRKFGWQHMGLPKCSGFSLKKNKVCLYLECPESLDESDKSDWVQTVFKVLAKDKIHFGQLPSSKKYTKKPRFMSFDVDPFWVEQVICQDETFPVVFPLGDAQIDPNFNLGHGVSSGMVRVGILLSHLQITKGVITGVDAEAYAQKVDMAIQKQKKEIQNYNMKRHEYFKTWLIASLSLYDEVLKMNILTPTQISFLKKSRQEVQGRISYQKAISLLSAINEESPNLQKTLDMIHSLFINVLEHLPERFFLEREYARLYIEEFPRNLLEYKPKSSTALVEYGLFANKPKPEDSARDLIYPTIKF